MRGHDLRVLRGQAIGAPASTHLWSKGLIWLDHRTPASELAGECEKKTCLGFPKPWQIRSLGVRDEELEFLTKVLANASTRQGLRITSLDPSEPLAEPLWTWHVSEKSAAVLSH